MNARLEERMAGPVLLLEAPAWSASGLAHGFAGRVGMPADRAGELETLSSVSPIRTWHRVKQVHGRAVHIVDGRVRAELPEADVLVAPRMEDFEGHAIAIVTADCVPLLISGDSACAAIHAGWRGLACGVIEAAIAVLDEYGPRDGWHVAVGPCADPALYEVGPEVIDAIGSPAAAVPRKDGKHLLDTQATAIAILEREGISRAKVTTTTIFTMSDPRFFSYRRDGAGDGRNVSFTALW